MPHKGDGGEAKALRAQLLKVKEGEKGGREMETLSYTSGNRNNKASFTILRILFREFFIIIWHGTRLDGGGEKGFCCCCFCWVDNVNFFRVFEGKLDINFRFYQIERCQ
jgi:hypothetical protein